MKSCVLPPSVHWYECYYVDHSLGVESVALLSALRYILTILAAHLFLYYKYMLWLFTFISKETETYKPDMTAVTFSVKCHKYESDPKNCPVIFPCLKGPLNLGLTKSYSKSVLDNRGVKRLIFFPNLPLFKIILGYNNFESCF